MFRWLETPQDFYVDTRGLRLSAEQAAKMEAPAGAGKRKAPGGGGGGATAVVALPASEFFTRLQPLEV